MSEQYLADIASELHSLNLNLCELIKVIKHSNNQPPITPPQLENELEKIQSIH
jgi:hypothetical protein